MDSEFLPTRRYQPVPKKPLSDGLQLALGYAALGGLGALAWWLWPKAEAAVKSAGGAGHQGSVNPYSGYVAPGSGGSTVETPFVQHPYGHRR